MGDPELDALFARIRNLTQVATMPPSTVYGQSNTPGTTIVNGSMNQSPNSPTPSQMVSESSGISLGFEASGPSPASGGAPPPLADFTRNRFALEEDRAQQLAARAARNAQRAKTVDICYVVDFTTSMEPWIERTKESIVSVVDAIRRDYLADAQLRVALIGYRDFDVNLQPRNFYFDFHEPWQLKSFLDSIHTDGNADFAEDVLGGLALVPGLSWANDTRMVILIGDAPAHGRLFHSFGESNDRWYNYPDPTGRSGATDADVTNIVKEIVNKRILFHVFRLTEHTAQMESVLSQVLAKFRQKWSCQDLGSDPSSFLQHVLATTVSSMRASGALKGH